MDDHGLRGLMLGVSQPGEVGVDVDIDGLEISYRGGALVRPPIRHQIRVPLGREPLQRIFCNWAIC